MKKSLHRHDWKPKQTVARLPACVWAHKPGLQRHRQQQCQRAPVTHSKTARDPQPSLPREGRNPPHLHKPLNLACNCAPSDARTGKNKCPNASPASLLSFLRPVLPAMHFICISSMDSRFNPPCLSSLKSTPTKSQSSCFLYTKMKKSLSARKA